MLETFIDFCYSCPNRHHGAEYGCDQNYEMDETCYPWLMLKPKEIDQLNLWGDPLEGF